MDSIYNLLSFEMAHALCWTLLHSIWQGLLIACILSLLIKHAKSIPSKSKSLVSIGALASLLVTSIITFCYYYELPTSEEQLTTLVQGDWNTVAAYLGTEQSQTYGKITDNISENSQYIVLAWMLGFVLFLLHLVFGLFQLHRLKQQLVPLSNYWQDRLEDLAEKINYSGKILLCESSNIQSPITFGLLKPVILFPVGMVNNLSIQEVEAIIAHELAHIVRKDYLINFVQTLLEGIYYFNPGVWIISSIIRNQREHCCDDMAIELTGNSVQYLKALVAIEEAKSENYLAMGFSSNKKPLLKRVQRILNQPQKNSNMKEKLIMTFIFLIGIMLFTLDLNSKDKNTEEEVINQLESIAILEDETTSKIEHNTITSVHLSNDILPISDTIPSNTENLEYLDKEEKYIDVPAFEEKIRSSEVKIVIEDGDIEEMKIDGRDLSEEEISKIQYNLSEAELDALKENANVKVYEDVESRDQSEENRIGIRREIVRSKAEIDRNKAEIRQEISRSKRESFTDKERFKSEIRAEKDRIKDIINQAKEQARESIRAANSYSKMSIGDMDDFGEDIAMNIREAFEEVEIELDELQEERIRITVDFAEDLAQEMQDLEEDLLDMQDDLLDDIDDIDDWYIDENYNTEEIIQIIERELLADKLIDNIRMYSFLLKKNKFQVNGKTLSPSLKAKYESLLEELTDNEWSSNSKLKINRKGDGIISGFNLKN